MMFKSALGLKIVLCILPKYSMLETELCEIFKKKQSNLRKTAALLQDRNIIKILTNNDSGEVYYVIHKRYFDIGETCLDCKFHDKENVNGFVKKICKRGRPPCEYSFVLTGNNIIKYLETKCRETFTEKYDRKINEREYRHTDKWQSQDFIAFYIESWQEYYPTLFAPEKQELRFQIKKLMKMFRSACSEDNWRRMLKRYIWETMKRKSGDKVLADIFLLDSKPMIQRFIRKNGQRVDNIKQCLVHNIYCSFWKNCDCSLPNKSLGCTKSIRRKMLDNYN